jgi:4-amino-4-deoxy-L-arabinose transferase-like glycosyltransferase
MKFTKLLLFILSVVCQFVVLSDVIGRSVNNVTLVLWIASLLFLFAAFPFREEVNRIIRKKSISMSNFRTYFFAFLIIVLALTARVILMRNTYAFHNDEYISAYFSYSLGDLTKLDWFGIYPIPRDWIWQFPVLYFFFQKLFFNIFGVGTLTMRLSILPYITIVFIFLFLITKRLYTKAAAYIAIAILAFFSPDLYLSRWALHFISCTAFFLLTTYFIVMSLKAGDKRHFALAGFFLGMCYMSYASSFIVAPLILFYVLVIIIKGQIQRTSIINFLLTIEIFVYTVSPLAIYAMKVENFVVTRANQIKLINGSWSPYQGLKIISKPTFIAVKNQAILSVKSLYTDGVGGAGGYTFGNLALFDRITFVFILLGIFYFFYRFIKKNDTHSLFFLVTILATFVTGMIFTIPPPAFHRISLVFPFICLLISVTVTDVCALISKKRRKTALFLFVVFVSAVLISNISHFRKIMAKDGPDDPDYPQIQQYLEQQKVNTFYIAAFDTYGMGGILFIRSGGLITSTTRQLDEILKEIPPNKTSYLVILYPNEELIQKVKMKYPNTAVVANYQKHALLRIN